MVPWPRERFQRIMVGAYNKGPSAKQAHITHAATHGLSCMPHAGKALGQDDDRVVLASADKDVSHTMWLYM